MYALLFGWIGKDIQQSANEIIKCSLGYIRTLYPSEEWYKDTGWLPAALILIVGEGLLHVVDRNPRTSVVNHVVDP